MIKKTVVFILVVCFNNAIVSQKDYSYNYFNIESKGDIPDDFKVSYIENFKSLSDNIDEVKLHEKRRIEYSLLREAYLVNYLFSSGNVLFGDDVTNYINDVAKSITLKKQHKDARFYVLKTNKPAVFYSSNGEFFITIGILAQIENEDQLAFLLAREIVHYNQDHTKLHLSKPNQNSYNDNQTFEIEDVIEDLSGYSLEDDIEADKKAAVILNEYGYNSYEGINAISVMQFSHLPFSDLPFDTNYFNSGLYNIPGSKFKLETHQEESDMYNQDEFEKRREALSSFIKEKIINNSKGDINQEKFNSIREISRLESLSVSLNELTFIKAFYEGYMLEKKYPNNQYIKKIIAKSLYGLAKLKTAEVSFSFNKDVGMKEYKRVCVFFDKNMNGLELSILALKYIKKDSIDGMMQHQIDLASDIYHKHNFLYEKFRKNSNDDVLTENKDTVSYDDMTKIEKIEYKKKTKKREENNSEDITYYKYAFVDELKQDEFVYVLNEGKMKPKQKDINEQKELSLKERQEMWRKEKFSVDKVIILDSKYLYSHSNLQVSLVKSEKKQIQYDKALASVTTSNGVEAKLLTSYVDNDFTVNQYNKKVQLKRITNELKRRRDLNMIPSNYDMIEDLVDYYGTNKILFSGVHSSRTSKNFQDDNGALTADIGIMFFSAFIAPLIVPQYLILFGIRQRENIYYASTYNLETMQFEIIEQKITRGKDNYYNNISVLNSIIKEISNKL